MKADINKIKQKIIPILKKHNVTRAGIFGSYARGEAKKGSDVDILVKVPRRFSLLDSAGLELELERYVRKNVDLLTYKGVHRLLKERILKEEVKIL